MMNIAICDESRNYTIQLTSMLTDLAAESEIEISVDVFRSYSYLQAQMKEKHYDLLLLETIIRGISGIDFARSLRLKKNETEIIFISSNADNALAAYSAFPIGYIIKPPAKRKLRAPFRRAADKFEKRKTIMLNDPNGGKVNISVDDLLYVEVIGTELLLHSRNGMTKCSGSLASTYHKLPQEQFYRSHRSYIVNMNYIVRAAKYYFVMENGDKVTIAKNRYAEAKNKLSNYIGI